MRPSTAELLPPLEAAVGPVSALQRTRSPLASTAALEAVRATLADGSSLDLVLKSGGRDTPREVAFYRDVLVRAGLGTPRFLAGSDRGPGWLLVEALAGGPLWRSGDLDHWCSAARWLASAHERLAAEAARQRSVIGSRYEEQLERAVERDARAADLRDACVTAAAALRGAARTVVHGEAFPSNVLVAPSGAVCLVDWETAGQGPGQLDLAALCAGWPAEGAARIAAAYADGSAPGSLSLLPAARLAVAVRWLGEARPRPDAGGGHARHTDWWAEAVAAAELLA